MTEEEINALQAAKVEAERRASEAEALAQAREAEAVKARGDVDKVVEELKELRLKKGEAAGNAQINNQEPDVNSLVEQALAEQERKRQTKELEEAIAEFKSSKTEFQSDAAGIVFGKFQEELKKFNFSEVSNKAQARARLEEVYSFVNRAQPETTGSGYEGGPRLGGDAPVRQDGPSKDVEAAMDMARMDKEKFTHLKSKYPEALASLGME